MLSEYKCMTVGKELSSFLVPMLGNSQELVTPALGDMTSLASMATCVPIYKHVYTKLIRNSEKVGESKVKSILY